jgi:hypothetical protein
MVEVANLARAQKGHATWTFSQSDFSVWRYYRTFGICAALSAEWIRYHAAGDSLANHLGGGGVGPLNVKRLKEIALLHGTVSNTGGAAQDRQLELFLQMHDILGLGASKVIKYFNSRAQKDMTRAATAPAAVDVTGGAPNIDNDIVHAMQKFNSCYARVNFGGKAWGTSAGHAIAVWLGQPSYSSSGDAMMFDPNYGEYWFERKADFFKFFPLFYRAKYRSLPMAFDQFWQVLPCAKRA